MTPRPVMVVATGMPYASASSTTCFQAWDRMAPPPAMMTGRRAAARSAAPAAIDSRLARLRKDGKRSHPGSV
jgi:hypothetical protein